METLGKMPDDDEHRRGNAGPRHDRKYHGSYGKHKSHYDGLLSSDVKRENNVKGGVDIKRENNNKTENSRNQSRYKCFNCGEAGHMAKAFKQPRKECTSCKLLGHIMDLRSLLRSMGHTREKSPYAKAVNEVGNTRVPLINLYVQTIRINECKIKGLIGTGSACMLIKASVANRLGVEIITFPDATLRGFAGQIIKAKKSLR